MKITKFKEDITVEIAKSFSNSVAIDTEATGLQIPERDKLSLIQICDEKGNVFIIQPNKDHYTAPNLVSILENEKILKIGHFLRFDKSALEYFLKCKIKNPFDHNQFLFFLNTSSNNSFTPCFDIEEMPRIWCILSSLGMYLSIAVRFSSKLSTVSILFKTIQISF